jgi:hypothetical protein
MTPANRTTVRGQYSQDQVGLSLTTCAESSDAEPRWVWVAGIGLLLTLWSIVLLLYPVFAVFTHERAAGKPTSRAVEYIPPQPPTPRNESSPSQVLARIQAQDVSSLTRYSWADRESGTITLPIDRAIELLLQRGVPAVPAQGRAFYPPQAGTMRTGAADKVGSEDR